MSDDVKASALQLIAAGQLIKKIHRSLYQVGDFRVHVRLCRVDPRRPSAFKFGINHATLSAHAELWICGDPSVYFLLPMSVIQSMYHDPESYVDRWHPSIRIASVDVAYGTSRYARGKAPIDICPFRGRRLEPCAA